MLRNVSVHDIKLLEVYFGYFCCSILNLLSIVTFRITVHRDIHKELVAKDLHYLEYRFCYIYGGISLANIKHTNISINLSVHVHNYYGVLFVCIRWG